MNNEDVCPINLPGNYLGGCENEPFSNENILNITAEKMSIGGLSESILSGTSVFALKYRVIPCKLDIEDHDHDLDDDVCFKNMGYGDLSAIQRRGRNSKERRPGMYHATSVINFLVTEYKADQNAFLYNWSYDPIEQRSVMENVCIDLGDYLLVKFDDGSISTTDVDNPDNLKPDEGEKIFNCFSQVQVFHVPQTAERAKTLLQQLSKFKLYPIISLSSLQMVCSSQHGLYTTSIRMKKPNITDLKLHYGDEFPSIHKDLLEILQEKDSTGITLLHGPPGTGKTYYLRYLINEIKDKSLIYIPPDLVNEMSKPGFIPFLMKHSNSILIVEDAENIIQDRTESFQPSQAVANLLNLSDGLLGDALHQQIICTFNCDVKKIDSALIRDGRLVLDHKFDKLSAENARRLCVELNVAGNGEDIHEPTSIAEIYSRKNGTVNDTTDGIEIIGPATHKRPLKQRVTEANPFGFYS